MKFIYNNSSAKGNRRILRKNQTEAEAILWRNIRAKQIGGYKFSRQYSVGNYVLDFYCPKKRLAIELDGGQHGEENGKIYDKSRTAFLESFNIKVLRFWNRDVTDNLDGVLITIRKELDLGI